MSTYSSALLRESGPAVAPRLAYLLAASHSGSTLLTMLLGAQPGAATVGELKATSLGHPGQYRCSCRKLIRECGFWRDIALAMNERGIAEFDITQAGTSIFEVKSSYAQRLLAPLHRNSVMEAARDIALMFSREWRKHLREATRRNNALVRSVLAVTGAQVVVDSSKIALRLKYLLKDPGLDVQVIRVLRDGRAVSLTYMDDWNFADCADPALRAGGTGVWRPPPRRNMADAANEWKRSNEAADCVLRQLPRGQWTEVRYEELCANPEATLRRLTGFLGLNPDEVLLDFRSRDQHVIGNGMRMDQTSEIKLDERWKTNLSSDDLRVFEAVAGDLNRKYGYQ